MDKDKNLTPQENLSEYKNDLGAEGYIVDTTTAYKLLKPETEFVPLSANVQWVDVDTQQVMWFPPLPGQLLLSHEMGNWPNRNYKAIVKENGETIALLKSDKLDTLRHEVVELEKSHERTHTIYACNEGKWIPISDYAN